MERPDEPRFIVLEGLDGVGKSTTARLLVQRLPGPPPAVLLATPPPELRALRAYFDGQAPAVRRAFYHLGNAMVSEEARAHLRSGASVVLDRYWPSTASYAALDDGAPATHPEWPADLLKPTHLVVLTLSEEERARRVRVREGPDACKPEERQLEASCTARDRVATAYSAILEAFEGVAAKVICDRLAPDEVAEHIIRLL